MKNDFTTKLAIVSIGNPLRGDDGIGHWVGEQVAQRQFPAVTVLSFHQLQTDVLDSWFDFDAILIVDAAINISGVKVEKVAPIDTKEEQNDVGSGTHHIAIPTLASLAEKLFQRRLNLTVCKIGSTEFEMGAPLSQMALENGKKALELISQWMLQESTTQ